MISCSQSGSIEHSLLLLLPELQSAQAHTHTGCAHFNFNLIRLVVVVGELAWYLLYASSPNAAAAAVAESIRPQLKRRRKVTGALAPPADTSRRKKRGASGTEIAVTAGASAQSYWLMEKETN